VCPARRNGAAPKAKLDLFLAFQRLWKRMQHSASCMQSQRPQILSTAVPSSQEGTMRGALTLISGAAAQHAAEAAVHQK